MVKGSRPWYGIQVAFPSHQNFEFEYQIMTIEFEKSIRGKGKALEYCLYFEDGNGVGKV